MLSRILPWLVMSFGCTDGSFTGSSGRVAPPPVAPQTATATTSLPSAQPAQHPNPTSPSLGGTAPAASTATSPATSTSGASAGLTKTIDVDCSSSQYQPCQQTSDCAQFTVPAGGQIQTVILKEQHSVADCGEGSSWSHDLTSLACWDGCRGTFTITYHTGP